MKKLRKKYKPALWTTMANARLRKPCRQSRASQLRQYQKEAHLFITEQLLDPMRQWCPVAFVVLNQKILVSQCHHKFGRSGKLLLWKIGWMAVSAEGHDWIHRNIDKARDFGWLAGKGLWNNPKAISP